MNNHQASEQERNFEVVKKPSSDKEDSGVNDLNDIRLEQSHPPHLTTSSSSIVPTKVIVPDATKKRYTNTNDPLKKEQVEEKEVLSEEMNTAGSLITAHPNEKEKTPLRKSPTIQTSAASKPSSTREGNTSMLSYTDNIAAACAAATNDEEQPASSKTGADPLENKEEKEQTSAAKPSSIGEEDTSMLYFTDNITAACAATNDELVDFEQGRAAGSSAQDPTISSGARRGKRTNAKVRKTGTNSITNASMDKTTSLVIQHLHQKNVELEQENTALKHKVQRLSSILVELGATTSNQLVLPADARTQRGPNMMGAPSSSMVDSFRRTVGGGLSPPPSQRPSSSSYLAVNSLITGGGRAGTSGVGLGDIHNDHVAAILARRYYQEQQDQNQQQRSSILSSLAGTALLGGGTTGASNMPMGGAPETLSSLLLGARPTSTSSSTNSRRSSAGSSSLGAAAAAAAAAVSTPTPPRPGETQNSHFRQLLTVSSLSRLAPAASSSNPSATSTRTTQLHQLQQQQQMTVKQPKRKKRKKK
jgi:hypothetical protein